VIIVAQLPHSLGWDGFQQALTICSANAQHFCGSCTVFEASLEYAAQGDDSAAIIADMISTSVAAIAA
jgi:hypothetical protein